MNKETTKQRPQTVTDLDDDSGRPKTTQKSIFLVAPSLQPRVQARREEPLVSLQLRTVGLLGPLVLLTVELIVSHLLHTEEPLVPLQLLTVELIDNRRGAFLRDMLGPMDSARRLLQPPRRRAEHWFLEAPFQAVG